MKHQRRSPVYDVGSLVVDSLLRYRISTITLYATISTDIEPTFGPVCLNLNKSERDVQCCFLTKVTSALIET